MALTTNDLQQRIGRITSSTAAACLGLDPKMSQIEAWRHIRGDESEPDPFARYRITSKNENLVRKAIERGNRLERFVLEYGGDYLGEQLGETIVTSPAPFRSRESWLGDSCDALYFPDNGRLDANDPWCDLRGVGEGKTASRRVGEEYGTEGTDEIPHHTLLQAHMHLIHWPEVDVCVVPVLVGSYQFEFRAYVVERNPEFEEIMLEDLYAWHREYIVGDKPPPARCSDDNWLKARCPEALKGVMPDSGELRNLAFAKWRASQHETMWKKQVCDAQARLRDRLGEYEWVRGYWGTISWKNNASSFPADWEAIARDYLCACEPEDAAAIVAHYTREKLGPRVLRVHVKKDYQDEALAYAAPEPEDNDVSDDDN